MFISSRLTSPSPAYTPLLLLCFAAMQASVSLILSLRPSVVAYARTDPHRTSYCSTVRTVRYGTTEHPSVSNQGLPAHQIHPSVYKTRATQQRSSTVLKYKAHDEESKRPELGSPH